MKPEPKFKIDQEVGLVPQAIQVTEVFWHSTGIGEEGGHYTYKLTDGNWYFEDEIVPY